MRAEPEGAGLCLTTGIPNENNPPRRGESLLDCLCAEISRNLSSQRRALSSCHRRGADQMEDAGLGC